MSSEPDLTYFAPQTVTQALTCSRWKQAMLEEYNALLNNQTRSLVPPPSDSKVIGCRWGSILRGILMALYINT